MGGGCTKCRSGRRHSCDSSCAPSERRSSRRRAPRRDDTDAVDADADSQAEEAPSEARRAAMDRLRAEFRLTPDLFLLSQMLLTVQFFRNFHKDRQRIVQLKMEKEEELNRVLKKEKKSVIYLGSPYEVIGENMEYRRSDNDEPRLGHDLDYLVVHDNVAVGPRTDELEPGDERPYKFIMQQVSSDGFTRLSQVRRPTPPSSRGRAAAFLDDPPARPSVVHSRPRRNVPRHWKSRSLDDGYTTAQRQKRTSAKSDDASDADERPAQQETTQRNTQKLQPEGETSPDVANDSADRLAPAPTQPENNQGTAQRKSGKGSAFMNQLKRKVRGDTSADVNLSDDDASIGGRSHRSHPPDSDEDNSRTRNTSGKTTDPSDDSDGKTQESDSKEHTAKHVGSSVAATSSSNGHHAKILQPTGTHQNHNQNPNYSQQLPYGPGYFGFHMHPGVSWIHNPYQMNGGGLASLPESPQTPQVPGQSPMGPPQFPQYAPFPQYQSMAMPYPLVPAAGMQHAGYQHPVTGQPVAGIPAGYSPNGFVMGGWGGLYMMPTLPTTEEQSHETIEPNGIVENGQSRNKTADERTPARKKTTSENGLLKPPKERHRRRKKRGSFESTASGSDVRSSTSSRNSLITAQDSTTTSTDEEFDVPGHLPRHCFRKMLVRIDDDDEPRLEKCRFLSAEIFLNFFTENFHRLATLMAQEVWLQQGGRSYLRGPAINCREYLRGLEGLSANARVIPTLLVDKWPQELTLDWRYRKRNELLDEVNKVRYMWPPKRVIQTICQEEGCNLVPQSSEGTDNKGLEWEVNFQQAEIRLINSLDLVHIQSWAIAKLFFTHFLAEFGCIKEQHVRHLMFWQFERNFRDWHLESLGRPFYEFIAKLIFCLQDRKLPHFFIPKRNLFDSTTEGSMASAQQKMQRVMENLLPNVIILMSRLKIRNEAFPSFDWRALYDNLLLSETLMMKRLLPELSTSTNQNRHDSLMFSPSSVDDDDEEDTIWRATRRQKAEQRYTQLVKAQQLQRVRPAARRLPAPPARRNTVLPTFADVSVKLHVLTSDFWPRTEAVLLLFIEHFIQMSDRLLKYGNAETALSYIDHTLNLCTLLAEQGRTEEVAEHRTQLHRLAEKVAALLDASSISDNQPLTEVDPDQLVMDGSNTQQQDNWTVGPAEGRRIRKNFNEDTEDPENEGSDDDAKLPESSAEGLRVEVHMNNPIGPQRNDGLFSSMPNGDVRLDSLFPVNSLTEGVRVNPLAALVPTALDEDEEKAEDEHTRSNGHGEETGVTQHETTTDHQALAGDQPAESPSMMNNDNGSVASGDSAKSKTDEHSGIARTDGWESAPVSSSDSKVNSIESTDERQVHKKTQDQEVEIEAEFEDTQC